MMVKKTYGSIIFALLLHSGTVNDALAEEVETTPCAAVAQRLEQPREHVSKYTGLRFCYPSAWALESEDQSIFMAQSADKEFWERFNPEKDFYFAVGNISPYLSLEDAKNKVIRHVTDFTKSTAYSLKITEKATVIHDAQALQIGRHEAASLLVTMGNRFQYQIILRLSPQKFATISVNGISANQEELSGLLNAMAETMQLLK